MTPIESIYEIQYAVLDRRRYIQSKAKVVSHRALHWYEQWVERFFSMDRNQKRLWTYLLSARTSWTKKVPRRRGQSSLTIE